MNETVGMREAAKKGDVRVAKDGSKGGNPPERIGRMLDPAVLGGLSIDLVAQLGRGTMTIDELTGLGSGEVVRLDTPLNGVIDLTLNGALVARGEIVAVDDQFGIRVTEILVRAQ